MYVPACLTSDGENLVTGEEGSWRPQWEVIGMDVLLGDPYLVDLDKKTLPVYTAMHGAGSWDPCVVSETLAGFLKALSHLQGISGQEESVVYPTDDTISSPSGVEELCIELVALCGSESCAFWKSFFQSHLEWIKEFGRIGGD